MLCKLAWHSYMREIRASQHDPGVTVEVTRLAQGGENVFCNVLIRGCQFQYENQPLEPELPIIGHRLDGYAPFSEEPVVSVSHGFFMARRDPGDFIDVGARFSKAKGHPD